MHFLRFEWWHQMPDFVVNYERAILWLHWYYSSSFFASLYFCILSLSPSHFFFYFTFLWLFLLVSNVLQAHCTQCCQNTFFKFQIVVKYIQFTGKLMLNSRILKMFLVPNLKKEIPKLYQCAFFLYLLCLPNVRFSINILFWM